MNAVTRRRRSKGRWMKLRDPKLLQQYMAANDFSQARLSRYAGCSRQFIHMLLNGDRDTCTPYVAQRIEEAVRVLPRTLFDDRESPIARPSVAARKTASV